MTGTAATTGLQTLYGDMTSVERVLHALAKDGLDIEHLRAADLYERNLDCQNLGAYPMLLTIAAAATEHRPLEADDPILDIGCGMGGPGRFLAEQYACQVTSIDVLPLRVEAAQALTTRTGLTNRISYQVGSATELPFDDATFAQAWMLDVSVHVEDKDSLFTQIARVLQPGGNSGTFGTGPRADCRRNPCSSIRTLPSTFAIAANRTGHSAVGAEGHARRQKAA